MIYLEHSNSRQSLLRQRKLNQNTTSKLNPFFLIFLFPNLCSLQSPFVRPDTSYSHFDSLYSILIPLQVGIWPYRFCNNTYSFKCSLVACFLKDTTHMSLCNLDFQHTSQELNGPSRLLPLFKSEQLGQAPHLPEWQAPRFPHGHLLHPSTPTMIGWTIRVGCIENQVLGGSPI